MTSWVILRHPGDGHLGWFLWSAAAVRHGYDDCYWLTQQLSRTVAVRAWRPDWRTEGSDWKWWWYLFSLPSPLIPTDDGRQHKSPKKIQSKNLQSPDIRAYIQMSQIIKNCICKVQSSKYTIGLCETKSTMASIAYQRKTSTKVGLTQKYSKAHIRGTGLKLNHLIYHFKTKIYQWTFNASINTYRLHALYYCKSHREFCDFVI